jgi:hypothetical protein
VPDGIRAVRRANGEYVIFVEEDWAAKVLMYRMRTSTTVPDGSSEIAAPAPTRPRPRTWPWAPPRPRPRP